MAKKKLRINRDQHNIMYMNWLAQSANLMKPKNLFAIVGRGGAKTTDILATRTIQQAYELAGAPVGLISDTYTNLQRNIIKALVESLNMKGWVEGIHFVIGKEPPSHFKKPNHAVIGWKHTIAYYTGMVDHCLSLDRASIGAGNSYVAIKGDEAKYLKPDMVANLTKAIRGYREYSKSPFYRGMTFTTDMPDVSRIGQYDWILSQSKRMDKKNIMDLLKVSFIVNDLNKELVVAMQAGNVQTITSVRRRLANWVSKMNKCRHGSTFFYIASSFINADILTAEYFVDEFSSNIDDLSASIFSIEPRISSGDRFYSSLNESHFYSDGNDGYWSEEFGINDNEDCRILRHLKLNKPIDMGLDVGKMNSLCIAQDDKDLYRILKFMYKLKPHTLKDLAKDIVSYFKHHRNRNINLYYDRSANKYEPGADSTNAEYFKKCIEEQDGNPTGWNVTLKSLNQANIESNLEYRFMEQMLGGSNRKLPKVNIDQYACKLLKSSLETAPTKIMKKKGASIVVKDKRSETLPTSKLPFESTNPSDAFKYLMCRRDWLKLMDGRRSSGVGNVSIH